MELNINEININRYANGELSGAELKAFEALLQQDQALREKIDSHQFMDAVLYKNVAKIDNDEQIALKPLFDKLGNKYFSENEDNKTGEEGATNISESKPSKSNPNHIKRLLPFAGLAAAALLLFLFLPNQNSKLFDKHFEPVKLENLQSPKGSSNDFEKANEQYGSKNYKQAIALYNNYLTENPDNPYALQFKGCAEMEINQIDKAINTFEQLAAEHNDFKNTANWYLALAHLKKGNKIKAKESLKLLTKADRLYYDKAQMLLKEL